MKRYIPLDTSLSSSCWILCLYFLSFLINSWMVSRCTFSAVAISLRSCADSVCDLRHQVLIIVLYCVTVCAHAWLNFWWMLTTKNIHQTYSLSPLIHSIYSSSTWSQIAKAGLVAACCLLAGEKKDWWAYATPRYKQIKKEYQIALLSVVLAKMAILSEAFFFLP